MTFRIFLETSARVFVYNGGVHTAGALPAVGPFVLVFGLVCGFLFMYLNTRLGLIRLFYDIENLLSGSEKLGSTEQRAVKAIAERGDGQRSFLQQQFTAKRSLTVQDALNLMFNLLYKDDPARVVETGARLSNTDAVNRPDYWLYLAAAFGQQLHHLEKGTDDWKSARVNAIDCAGRAVALDPAYKDRLWHISEPGGSDDDLAPLRDDREFLRLVGRPLPDTSQT